MKELKKEITYYSISAIFFTLLFVIAAIVIANKIYYSKEKITYVEKDFMISMKQNIKEDLSRLSDINGLKKESYPVNITNNGKTRKYQLLLEPIIDQDAEIRISLDSYIISNLSNFKKENNYYIIYEGELEEGYSFFHNIGIWLKEESKFENYSINTKLKVKIFDTE